MIDVQCKCGLWFRMEVKKLKFKCPACGTINRVQSAEVVNR